MELLLPRRRRRYRYRYNETRYLIALCFVYTYVQSIQCYRLAHVLWSHGRRDFAMTIQARCSEVFGVDIHPGARIAGGLMIDHGTGARAEITRLMRARAMTEPYAMSEIRAYVRSRQHAKMGEGARAGGRENR